MPARMGYRLVSLLLSFGVVVGVALLGGCGKEIGDACIVGSDCSPNGDRLCDPSSVGGYCTIQGCDYSTCPEEAACVRFFTGSFLNRTCDPAKTAALCSKDPADCCSLDELCSIMTIEGEAEDIKGHCVPRSSEVRYCMRTCDSDGDCRDGYECRDLAKMKEHGGEPVLASGQVISSDGNVIGSNGLKTDEQLAKFCAATPATP